MVRRKRDGSASVKVLRVDKSTGGERVQQMSTKRAPSDWASPDLIVESQAFRPLITPYITIAFSTIS